MLEQVRHKPNWHDALAVALVRPPGIPERRAGEDPWGPPQTERPRRATDDLAWLRGAVDEPLAAQLRALGDDPRMRAWEVDEPELEERLSRLRDRGILDAAGFALHATDAAETA